MPHDNTTPRAPSAPNPPHPRVEQALTRYLNSSPSAVVLQHVVSPKSLGDLLAVYLDREGEKRLAIRRITPTGGTVEIRIRESEITALACALSEFRQRVSPPSQDEPRGRRRGAR